MVKPIVHHVMCVLKSVWLHYGVHYLSFSRSKKKTSDGIVREQNVIVAATDSPEEYIFV